MKRLLMLSDLYAPENQVGAMRATKLTKYLSRDGYSIDVVTSAVEDWAHAGNLGDTAWANRVIRLSPNPETAWTVTTGKTVVPQLPMAPPPTVKSGMADELMRVYRKCNFALMKPVKYHLRDSRDRKRAAGLLASFQKLQKSGVLNLSDYDGVISSYGPLASVLWGLAVKEAAPDLLWLCDLRDPMVNEDMPAGIRSHYQALQTKACQQADVLTIVSQGYLRRICGDQFSKKAHMIPNGYDPDDLPPQAETHSQTLDFAYVGALYNGKRDLSPLFAAIAHLSAAGSLDTKRVRVHYAGTEYQYLEEQAQKYGLGSIVVDHGRLSRSDCLTLQCEAQFLLLSTWNSRGEEGVFPGKFLEYLLIGRPIVALVDGDLPGSEVAEVIRAGNLGFAHEAAAGGGAQLESYLLEQYLAFLKTGQVPFQPDPQVVARYDYHSIVRRFEELLS